MEEREIGFGHDPFARRKSVPAALRQCDAGSENQKRRGVIAGRQSELKFRSGHFETRQFLPFARFRRLTQRDNRHQITARMGAWHPPAS